MEIEECQAKFGNFNLLFMFYHKKVKQMAGTINVLKAY